jgi:hypothetical protein
MTTNPLLTPEQQAAATPTATKKVSLYSASQQVDLQHQAEHASTQRDETLTRISTDTAKRITHVANPTTASELSGATNCSLKQATMLEPSEVENSRLYQSLSDGLSANWTPTTSPNAGRTISCDTLQSYLQPALAASQPETTPD